MPVTVSIQPATPRYVSQAESVGVVAANTTRPWLPTDVGDLMLWVRADSITGKVNGETVGIWNDESGQGNNLYAPDSGRAPVYQTNAVNGLPVLYFNNDIMISLLSLIGASSKMFMVVKTLNHGSYATDIFITGSNSPTRIQRFGTEKTPDNYIGLEHYFNGIVATQAAFTPNQYQVIRTFYGCYSGKVTTISVDGTEATGSQASAISLGQLAMGTYTGGLYSHTFYIAELFIYGSYSVFGSSIQNSDLSTADRNQALAYLANKYAITMA